MKKLLIAVLFIGICFGSGLAWKMNQLEKAEKALPRDIAAGQFGAADLKSYQIGSDYDAVLNLQADSTEPGAARLFFEVKDKDNYSVLEISSADWGGDSEDSDRSAHDDSSTIRVLRICGGVLAQEAQSVPDRSSLAKIYLRRRGNYLDVFDAKSNSELLSMQLPQGEGDKFGCAPGKNSAYKLSIESLRHSLEPSFADDFMRGPGDPGEWTYEGGNWQVRSLDNPGRSSNAFIMQGSGNGIALSGGEFWSSYRVECSALLAPGGQAGLVAAAADGGKLVFTIKDSPQGSVLPSVELVYEGQGENPLGEDLLTGTVRAQPGISGQWRRLALEVGRNRVLGYLDGRLVADLPLKRPMYGRAGMVVYSKDEVEFDDFRINPVMVLDSQKTDSHFWQKIPVKSAAGSWELMLCGGAAQPDVEVKASVIPQNGHPFGMVGAYDRSEGWIASIIDPENNTRRLSLFRNGIEEILQQENLDGYSLGKAVEMSMSFEDGYVKAQGLEAFLPDLKPGRWGVIVRTGSGAGLMTSQDGAYDFAGLYTGIEKDLREFAANTLSQTPAEQIADENAPLVKVIDFSLKGLVRPRPAVSRNEVFDLEREMAIWSGESGMWRQKGEVLWFRSLLFNDQKLELSLPDKMPQDGKVLLSICKPQDATSKNNGYLLGLERTDGKSSLQLMRSGKQVASHELGDAYVSSFSLRRSGGYLCVYADNKPVIIWKDKEPLAGGKLAWTASGGFNIKDFEPARVYARDITEYAFNSAPCDWRMAGGLWQVQNRWECDPRWSFMSGMPVYLAQERRERYVGTWVSEKGKWLGDNISRMLEGLTEKDKKSRLAAIWHKREFTGDVTVEMYAGPMMDQNRNREMGQYKYFRNFAMSICADGDDLDSGYSFIAGYNNQKSVIMRKGKVVAEVNTILPQSGRTHHNWYRFVASKHGADLEFSVYEQRSGGRESPVIGAGKLVYHDPEPLDGGQVAIWSHDTGMMLARAWISAENFGTWENPFRLRERVSACIFEKAQANLGASANIASK